MDDLEIMNGPLAFRELIFSAEPPAGIGERPAMFHRSPPVPTATARWGADQSGIGGCGALFQIFGFQEALELSETRGMPHLAQGFGFDLPDSFAGDLELLAHFLERAGIPVPEAKA